MLGSFFQKGIGIITAPIFTRVMEVRDYGTFGTYGSCLALLTMFISSVLYMSVRLAAVEYKERIDTFLSTVVIYTVFKGIVFSLLALLITYVTGRKEYSVITIVCIVQAISESVMMDFIQYYMMNYEYRICTILMVVPSLLSSVASIFMVIYLKNDKYWGRIIPTLIIGIFFSGILLFRLLKRVDIVFDLDYLKYGLKISTPLIAHGIALTILASSDRIMITRLRGTEDTGIYSLLYNLGMIATVFTSAIDGVWGPWFITSMRELEEGFNDNESRRTVLNINNVFEKYVRSMTLLMGIIMLVGPEIVRIMADERYWKGITIIPPIVIANYFVFIYSFFVNVEHYYKRTIIISINTIFAALMNIVLNYIFVGRYGYVAAANTTAVSYLFSLVLHTIYARRLERRLFNLGFIIKQTVIIIAFAGVFYLSVEHIIMRAVMVLTVLMIVLFYNKDLILIYVNRMRRDEKI